MSLIDRDLVRALNSGRCFALIGSGPSCEIGLPSWKTLAIQAVEYAKLIKGESISEQITPLLTKIPPDYPRVFEELALAIGIGPLAGWLVERMKIGVTKGKIYEYIASWPFACYLTTNYDGCLKDALNQIDIPVVTKLNRQEDMVLLRSDAKDLIFKIHGEPSSPDTLVLTSTQYEMVRKDPTKAYWREKMSALLHMTDIVIIGYSASDPDFRDQLERAKDIAAPDHPVFMFASGLSNEEINDLFSLNIRVISYDNNDGTHHGLLQVLARHDPFIAKRGTHNIGIPPVNAEEAELAASIYMFSHLRLDEDECPAIQNAYCATILQLLAESDQGGRLIIPELQRLLAQRLFALSNLDPVALEKSVDHLRSRGFISVSPDQNAISLELPGRQRLATAKAEKDVLRQRFEESIRLSLGAQYPKLSSEEIATIIDCLENGLTTAFKIRGLEIARSVFLDQPVDISGSMDVLDTINKAASSLATTLAAAYSDAMIEIILQPSEAVRSYLAALSQGYFAYHALGLEPHASQDRLELAKKKLWILDSSILIPLLAKYCVNHQYAYDLITRAAGLGFRLQTTELLFNEIFDHARFAIDTFWSAPPSDPKFILAATGQAGYRPNLFIDGYVHWSVEDGNPSLKRYFSEILKLKDKSDLSKAIHDSITGYGITIVPFDATPGFPLESYAERDNVITPEIRKLRQRFGTYRSDTQCQAEAEIIIVARNTDTIFLSRSSLLNRLRNGKNSLTWKPESFYRFLSLFTSNQPQEDLLFQSMVQDLYSIGFSIIDKDALSRFAAPTIKQARMNLEAERSEYEEILGRVRADQLIDQFEQTPDEQKPFYSTRFAFYVAAAERQRRIAAESAASTTIQAKSLTEKERRDYEKLKKKQAERQHRSNKNKRRRQSEKGKKK
jgi:hypothetical protein